MRWRIAAGAVSMAAGLALAGGSAGAVEKFHAVISGDQELGALNAQTGAIFSTGKGELFLELDEKTRQIHFKETYSGLSSPVTQSHIHFGKAGDSGGVIVFFCSNLGNGPAGTQPCPANGGTVLGTLLPADVVAVATQNVPAGSFAALQNALLSDTAYLNIHTTKFPAGEIRGQIIRTGPH